MKNQDKYTKASTLSFQLQKYEIKQRERLPIDEPQTGSIQAEQIVVPQVSNQSSPKPQKVRPLSREKNYEKSSSLKFTERKSSVDLEDQNQLLQKCMSLSSKVELLKKEKYQYAVQQFQEEQRKKLQFLFQKQKKAVNQKYTQRRNEIKQIHERESVRIAKGLEDIKKFKQAYHSIVQDLAEKKSKLQREYERALQEILQVKDKLVQQWKRSSNQQIIKKCNIMLK